MLCNDGVGNGYCSRGCGVDTTNTAAWMVAAGLPNQVGLLRIADIFQANIMWRHGQSRANNVM
jgi:hypothetical protein